MCGECEKCPSTSGGYQVHLTINGGITYVCANNFIKQKGIELILITNFTEHSVDYQTITSKNYKTLEEAMYEMSIVSSKLKEYGYDVYRSKIEAAPNICKKYLYKEIHYKVDSFEGFDSGTYLLSENSKGQKFATIRVMPSEEFTPLEGYVYRAEDVIFDTYINYDIGGKLLDVE